jgi:hypothetical protein
MTIALAGYTFEGPYTLPSKLANRSGVYAILTQTSSNNYKVVDVGESADVRDRVENHDRSDCWKRNSSPISPRYAAHYTPGMQQPGRAKIEQKVRDTYNPPCGDR